MNAKWIIPALTAVALAGAPAFAQQQFVYPSKGQSPQQQQKDEYECHGWAAQQSGYDPTKSSGQAAAAGPAPGSGVRGAARGAMVGGVIGSIGGNDVSNAAGKGAVVGAIAGRQRSRQQQTAAAQSAGPDAYNRARSGCLSGRGYNVN